MPGMLARSKSLRFLKNVRKDAQLQEDDQPTHPNKAFQTPADKFRSATPVLRGECRLTAPDQEMRPNTSGGPGDRTSAAFHMNKHTASAFQSTEHVRFRPSPMHSNATLSTTEITEEQGIIGIALGSPTVGSHWNSTRYAPDSTTVSHEALDQMQPHGYYNGIPADRPNVTKSKLSRWKSLFKKAVPPPQDNQKPSFYQLAQTVTAMAPRADSHHDEELPNSQDRNKHMIETIRTASPSTYRPNIRASRKGAPDGFNLPQSPEDTQATRARALTLGDLHTNARPPAKIQRAFTTHDTPLAVTPNADHGVRHVNPPNSMWLQLLRNLQ